jgi:hypothetical protein
MQVSKFFGILACLVVTESFHVNILGRIDQKGGQDGRCFLASRFGMATRETRRRISPDVVKMSIDFYHPCWKGFIDFHEGTWKGKALHIGADTADYVPPFVSPEYQIQVKHDSDRQAATFSCSSEVPGLLQEGATIVASDEFDATEDGAYSLDREMVSIPGIPGPPMRLAIDMTLPITADERVRCSILYDSAGRLSRVVLFEETRLRGTVAAPPSYRERMTLADFVGSYSGDALSRRTWRLGGGTVRFRSAGPPPIRP